MTDDTLRSRFFANILSQRKDQAQRQLIDDFSTELDYAPLDKLMISHAAWDHVQSLGIEPRIVFAHPDLLRAHPTTSLYYRGMAILSRKRVGQVAAAVQGWEDGSRKTSVPEDAARKVACLYNTMISSIIEGSTNWTLENGYRNIIATMSISLDGMFRNRIGDMAEELIKNRLVAWLKSNNIITPDSPEHERYLLPQNTIMIFGSEPDIGFQRDNQLIATIEVKGGRDPAGALERCHVEELC